MTNQPKIRYMLPFIFCLCLIALVLGNTRIISAQSAANCVPEAIPRGVGAFVRGGPGVEYSTVATITPNQPGRVLGRSAVTPWWRVEMTSGSIGWAYDGVVNVFADQSQIAILTNLGNGSTLLPSWTPSSLQPCDEKPATVENGFVSRDESTFDLLTDDIQPIATASAEHPYSAYNLSNSGGASNATLVNDGEGNPLVVWQDVDQGILIAQRNDSGWQRSRLGAPFNQLQIVRGAQTFMEHRVSPQLHIADGELHALWVDDSGLLLHANRPYENADAAWSEESILASGVLGFDVSNDGTTSHVAFLTSGDQENDAGIYFTSFASTGWNTAIRIAAAPYLRQQSVEEANIVLLATSRALMVSWDDTVQGHILLARSINAGESWVTSVVDRRIANDTQLDVAPHNVRLVQVDTSVYMQWQAGHAGSGCQHHLQSSSDFGRNWTEPTLLTTIDGCLDTVTLLPAEDSILIVGELNNEPTVLSFDNNRWSEPQNESLVVDMTDPRTFRALAFDCLQASVADTLWQIGCETNSGDVWFFERELDNIDHWFPSEITWQGSQPIPIPAHLTNLQTQIEQSGALHAIWQEDQTSLRYARLQNGRWSSTVTLFERGNLLHEPQIHLHDETLYASWQAGDSAGLMFSRVDVAFAGDAAEWTEPMRVDTLGMSAATPRLVTDVDGALFITYVVPVNEGRGVYVVHSTDSGTTWAAPQAAFTTEDPAWQIVSQPQLTVDVSGALHAQWMRQSAVNNGEILGVYYSKSDDGGTTWDSPTTIGEGSIIDAQLLTTADGMVHRFWRAADTFDHEVSADFGETWSVETPLADFSQLDGATTFLADSAGRLYLSNTSGSIMNLWVWNGNRWQSDQTYRVSQPNAQFSDELTLDSTQSGALVAIALIEQSSNQLLLPIERETEPFVAEVVTPRPVPLGANTAVVEESSNVAQQVAQPTVSAIRTPPTEEVAVTTAPPSIDPSIVMQQSPQGFPALPSGGNMPLFIGIALAALLIVPTILISRFSRRGSK